MDKNAVRVIRSEAAFHALLTKHDAVVVEFFMPWCTVCRDFVPTMAKVAKKMASSAKFARVDTREARTLGRRFQVQCKKPCMYTVFKKGEGEYQIRQQLRADELQKELVGYTGTAVRDLSAVDVRKFTQSRLAAVGSFASKDSTEFRAVLQAASSNIRQEVSFGALVGDLSADDWGDVGRPPALKLYRPFDAEIDGGHVSYNGPWENTSIVEWLQEEKLPLAADWSGELQQKLEALQMPMGVLFLDLPASPRDDDFAEAMAAAQPLKALVSKVAAEFKAKLRVLVASSRNAQLSYIGFLMDDLGLPKGAAPAFGILDWVTGRKFAFKGRTSPQSELTESHLLAFVRAWSNGTATPTFKSEPEPEGESTPSGSDVAVRKLVQSTFSVHVEHAAGDVLLELFSEATKYGTKHKILLRRLELLASALRQIGSATIVTKMDSLKNAELREMYGSGWQYSKYAEFSVFLVRKGQVRSPVRLPAIEGNEGDEVPSETRLLQFVHERGSIPFDLKAATRVLLALKAKEDAEEEHDEHEHGEAGHHEL